MTTKVPECASEGRMYHPITWEQFEQKFREAFGRDMTSDEHCWFHCIWTGVNATSEEKRKGAAA